MGRPVARAGVAAAILCGLTGLFLLAVPAFLPSWHAAWLVKPLIGIEVRPLQAESLGFGLGADLAVSVALGTAGVVALAFFLDHCVTNQPMWAVLGGWGLFLSGFVTSTAQAVVSTSRATFIDIDHRLWPLGLVPAVIGATVIVVSWWRAPELFSPHLSRWTVLALIPATAIVAFARESGMAPAVTFALIAVIVLTALAAGERIAGRSSAQSGGDADPA
jgi:hypothetical protein